MYFLCGDGEEEVVKILASCRLNTVSSNGAQNHSHAFEDVECIIKFRLCYIELLYLVIYDQN